MIPELRFVSYFVGINKLKNNKRILKLMVILTVKDISILGDRIPKILIWELPFGKMIGGILLKSNSMPD